MFGDIPDTINMIGDNTFNDILDTTGNRTFGFL